MNELLQLYNRFKRSRSEPFDIIRQIEQLGGVVEESRPVARLVPSPFKGLRIHPLLYEMRVVHGRRRGYWYVRTSGDGGASDWVWLDAEGYETLPVDGVEALVTTNLSAVGWTKDGLILGGVILAGLVAWLLLIWFVVNPETPD